MILIFLHQPLKAKPAPFARYRSTATLISLILLGGHQSPHRTIDKYVEVITGFRPTDGKGELEPPLDFGFTKLNFGLNFEDLSESSCFL
jgi:hypothetical protein